jgi:phage gp36-like protein
MPYATVADITSEFKDIDFSASNAAVTTTEVEKFLTETDALINATVANRYTTPITGTISLLIVKKIEIDIVCCRVAKILNLKKEVPTPNNSIVQEMNYGAACKKSEKLLEDISSGGLELPDAPVSDSSPGISSYNADNNILPIFERDTKQW